MVVTQRKSQALLSYESGRFWSLGCRKVASADLQYRPQIHNLYLPMLIGARVAMSLPTWISCAGVTCIVDATEKQNSRW
jgi:hypothetical protein